MPLPATQPLPNQFSEWLVYLRRLRTAATDKDQRVHTSSGRSTQHNICKRLYLVKRPACSRAAVAFLLLVWLLFALAWMTLVPRVSFPQFATVPPATLEETMIQAHEVFSATPPPSGGPKGHRKEDSYRAPRWLVQDELDWEKEDLDAYRSSLHRQLSPQLLEAMTSGWFHESLPYAPWTLPRQPRRKLFDSIRAHLVAHVDLCGVAAPSFRVYLNLLAVRWPSVQALSTYDAKNDMVFLRNIHVTPVAPEGEIASSALLQEHSDMCISDEDAYVPQRRYQAVWLTSDEIPQGIVLHGNDALCAQHFNDVFRGMWPCSESQRSPRLINNELNS
jgi:hypothetical protein